MKRRRVLLLLALVAVVAGIFLLCSRGPEEPVYQGRTLSQWIAEAHRGLVFVWSKPDLHNSPEAASEAACQAIRAIGTKSLPWLLSEFGRSESLWRVRFNGWANGRLPDRFLFNTGADAERVETAFLGLTFLGPGVAPALPDLARYLDDFEHGGYAALAMTGAGELALPYLLKALASTNELTATRALGGLQTLAPTVENALLAVLRTLQHTNKTMRERVLYFLIDFKSRPDLVIPALTKALSDPDGSVKRLASRALAKRGDAARPALPELHRLMTHPDPVVAGVARNAVYEIDPAAQPPRKQ